MNHWKNLLLIAGTNRNVGKTTLACRIIASVSKYQKVIGVKITPHVHEDCSSCQVLYSSDAITITQEFSTNTKKDSSKMLEAGASVVYYIQANDENIPFVIGFLRDLIDEKKAVICESAAMRDYLVPGKFILLSEKAKEEKNTHLKPLADVHIRNFEFENLEVIFKTDGWQIKRPGNLA